MSVHLRAASRDGEQYSLLSIQLWKNCKSSSARAADDMVMDGWWARDSFSSVSKASSLSSRAKVSSLISAAFSAWCWRARCQHSC